MYVEYHRELLELGFRNERFVVKIKKYVTFGWVIDVLLIRAEGSANGARVNQLEN